MVVARSALIFLITFCVIRLFPLSGRGYVGIDERFVLGDASATLACMNLYCTSITQVNTGISAANHYSMFHYRPIPRIAQRVLDMLKRLWYKS